MKCMLLPLSVPFALYRYQDEMPITPRPPKKSVSVVVEIGKYFSVFYSESDCQSHPKLWRDFCHKPLFYFDSQECCYLWTVVFDLDAFWTFHSVDLDINVFGILVGIISVGKSLVPKGQIIQFKLVILGGKAFFFLRSQNYKPESLATAVTCSSLWKSLELYRLNQ